MKKSVLRILAQRDCSVFLQSYVSWAFCLLIGAFGSSLSTQAGERPLKSGEIKPELLYHNYCSVCHGDRGDGRSRASNSLVPPPRDFTSATNLTRELMIATVTNGKPGTAMTSWKTQLNEKEIAAVVDYIRNGFMQAAIDPLVARGRSIYGHNCAVCHGESGKGPLVADPRMGNPPRDLSSQQARADLNRERLVAAISRDKHATGTEGFASKLSRQDIDAVADYIAKVIMVGSIDSISGTRARGAQSQESSVAGEVGKVADGSVSAPLPSGMKGNPQRGEKSYMVNCQPCHGAKGDGQGPRAFFISPKPRNFTDASSSVFNRPMLFVSISNGKPGTVMPAWGKVLKEQEIADIAEFVYGSFIRPAKPEQASGK